MSLKSALFEMKEALNNHQAGKIEEAYIQELEMNHRLNPGTLVFYYNHLMMLAINNENEAKQSSRESKKINRKWTNNEIQFMFQYIQERQDEGVLNITEILEEVAQLLNRGYQSVNYKYYTIVKTKDKTPQTGYQFTTIAHKNVPVLATETVEDLTPALPVNQSEPEQGDDLLDILSGLITNVQQLPGINLHELLRSLYQLTNLALHNQEAVQQIETMKSEINGEKKALRDKLAQKEQQLMEERKRNNELKSEIAKLAKEIAAFSQLGDAAKIQNLKSYNQRLNYLVDGSGVVLQVGS
ncbi:hypothetical protein [Neobacillus jeddahensis]|uniref:hypothetical protein n=1 Tax=Neobacillus jeddahensis TaxID=1461580 RepID=UPI000590B63F|nr:hypothetical protein [Neobacillus jeddahensis]